MRKYHPEIAGFIFSTDILEYEKWKYSMCPGFIFSC